MKRLLFSLCLAGGVFAQVVPSYKDLKYPPLPQVKIPEPTTFTLANGMKVFLLEDHELPLVHGLALIRTGNLFDPPDKKGLSGFTAEVLRSGGTKSKTGDQIDEELENMAASVEAGMEETSGSMSFSALKENADTVLSVFKEVMTAPEFREDKLELAITQTRSGIARRNDDAGSIPDRELQRLVYGPTTPYGWQVEYEDLNHIHRDDLVKFYHRYYFPKNIMLAVYGDFKIPEMKEKLEKLFADWTVRQPDVPKFPDVTAKAAPGIYLAEKTDVTQTFFAMGELGGTLRDKDYAALQVAANILGQGFTSRLLSQIRTKLGYAYDISASWSANWDHPGTFRIEGSTKSQSTTETLLAARVELDKMRTTEVTPRELDEAKQGVLNSFVFFFDSPAKTLNRVMRYEYYGYPKDFLFQYQKAIAAVTRADVRRVAKEKFLPENLAIVAVGNPKEFGKPLSALGKVNTIDLTIPEPKSEKKVDAPKADPAALERGKAILKRAQQAMGGADKLASIKDMTQSAEMTMSPAAGGMKIKQQNRWIAPSQFRQDQILPIGTIVAYFDGKSGWLSLPQGVLPMPPQVVRQAQGEIFREWLTLVLSDRDPSRTVVAADGKEGANAVDVSGAEGESVHIEIDGATGLPARQVYKETNMGGPPSEVTETFSDWRNVDGIKMPFKVLIEQNGKKTGEAAVSEIKLNSGLKPEELSMKPAPAKK
jgi:predicted Zn-dependent peptidase